MPLAPQQGRERVVQDLSASYRHIFHFKILLVFILNLFICINV